MAGRACRKRSRKPARRRMSFFFTCATCLPLSLRVYGQLPLLCQLRRNDLSFVWAFAPQKYRSHIDASHSRQPLVKGERLVRYEVNAVMPKGLASIQPLPSRLSVAASSCTPVALAQWDFTPPPQSYLNDVPISATCRVRVGAQLPCPSSADRMHLRGARARPQPYLCALRLNKATAIGPVVDVRDDTVSFPVDGVCCYQRGAMPAQHTKWSEQAQESQSPSKDCCDKQVSSWRHISCHTDKNRYYT